MSATEGCQVENRHRVLRMFQVNMENEMVLRARNELPHLLMRYMRSTDVFRYILLAIDFVDRPELQRFLREPITDAELTAFFTMFWNLSVEHFVSLLNILCNLEDYPNAAKNFRDTIESKFPATVHKCEVIDNSRCFDGENSGSRRQQRNRENLITNGQMYNDTVYQSLIVHDLPAVPTTPANDSDTVIPMDDAKKARETCAFLSSSLRQTTTNGLSRKQVTYCAIAVLLTVAVIITAVSVASSKAHAEAKSAANVTSSENTLASLTSSQMVTPLALTQNEKLEVYNRTLENNMIQYGFGVSDEKQ